MVVTVLTDMLLHTETRFISMELFYVPDIRKEYKPKGWMPGTTDKLRFARAEGWEKRTETLQQLSSTYHR